MSVPVESVKPCPGLMVPAVVFKVTAKSEMPFPVESTAATATVHAPVAGPPAAGVAIMTRDPIAVAAVLTRKLAEFEGPPPGGGFVTATAKDPAVAWSLALSEMVNWAELTNVAAWAALL
ncbi:MAG: hypothetical protein ABSH52_20360 [Terriglobia bacterium]|jgi:hypothetical protein